MSMGFSRQEYWSRLPCPPPGARENYTSTIPEPLMSDYIWLQCLYWERMQVHILSNCYNWREGKLKVAGFLKLNISHQVLPTLEVENIISLIILQRCRILVSVWIPEPPAMPDVFHVIMCHRIAASVRHLFMSFTHVLLISGFFSVDFFLDLFLNTCSLLFSWAGSPSLHMDSLSLQRAGATLPCGVQVPAVTSLAADHRL